MLLMGVVRETLAWRRKHPRAYNGLRLLVGVAFSAGLGWQAVRGLRWAEVGASFQEYPLLYGLAALGVFLGSNLIRAYRWQLLFLNERVSLLRLFFVQNAGIGLNNLMPVRTFSEVTQFALLTIKSRVTPGTALATLGMERVFDIAASTLLFTLGLALLPEMGGVQGFWPQLAFALLLTAVSLGLMRFLAWGSRRLAWMGRVSLLGSLGQALAQLEQQRLRMAVSFLATLGYWLCLGASAWVLAQGMRFSVSFSALLVTVVAVTFISTSLPSLPGAVGTFEFSTIYMLGFFGVDRAQALSYAVLLHALLYLPPVLFALVILPREGLAALRSVQKALPSGTSRP
ncbi:MAG: flippase-like domain-containing protein [Chloroflexi bacterium]|nr:flippase-like domain-containing protein [Chloroflexota bacterium]